MNILVDQDPTTGKYILRFNASLYKESDCMRFVFYKSIAGLEQKASSNNNYWAAYGNAYHRGLKQHYLKQPDDVVIASALDYFNKFKIPESVWQNQAHLVNCLMQYFQYWQQEGELLVPVTVGGETFIEKNFAFPFIKTATVDVLLCGTFDMVANYCGYTVIPDHKTRTLNKVNDFEIEKYFKSYTMSVQLMFYKYVYEKLFPGAKVDNLINGIFLDEKNRNKFKRSTLYSFSDEQMKLFEEQLESRVKEVINRFDIYINTGASVSAFPQNFTCCSQYCDFLPLCSLQSSSDVPSIIELGYNQKKYDPLMFQK